MRSVLPRGKGGKVDGQGGATLYPLVEAVGVLELEREGLSSSGAGRRVISVRSRHRTYTANADPAVATRP